MRPLWRPTIARFGASGCVDVVVALVLVRRVLGGDRGVVVVVVLMGERVVQVDGGTLRVRLPAGVLLENLALVPGRLVTVGAAHHRGAVRGDDFALAAGVLDLDPVTRKRAQHPREAPSPHAGDTAGLHEPAAGVAGV